MIVFLGIVFALLVLAVISILLLRRQLREKYALLWLIIGIALLILTIFPGLLFALSEFLGVEVPSNLIFVLSIVLLVGVTLHLSWELSRAEDEVRRVAEDVAIVRADLESLTARIAEMSRKIPRRTDRQRENPVPVAMAEPAPRGLRTILVATAIAGVFGYGIQLLAPRMLTDESAYIAFTVFWSTLYFGIAAMSGIQQEIARAAAPVVDEPPSATLRNFTLAAAGTVTLAAGALAYFFGDQILPGDRLQLAVLLAIGFVGFLANTVLGGVLYGMSKWRPVAELIVIDGGIRAILVISGFAAQVPLSVLALGVVFPFGAAFGVVWVRFRGEVVGHYRLDVSFRRLTTHVIGTVGAATATGVMITGLPMLIGLTSAGEPEAAVGSLILAITLTRAPIVIPVIALQSFLISAVFRGGRVQPGRLLRMLSVALAGIAALAAVGALIGPPLIEWISIGRFEVTGWMAATIVASAGLVGAMCVTGPALIAVRGHLANVIGWAIAAALTVGALLLPFPLDARVGLALLLPPLIGLAFHSVALVRRGRLLRASSGDQD